MKRATTTIRTLLPCYVAILACCAPAFAQVEFPPNDECVDAEVIGGEGVFPFDNIRPAEHLLDTCEFVNDVWYCWTSPCDGLVTIDTCGTTLVDTRFGVYEGCVCPPPPDSLLECEDFKSPGPMWPLCFYQSRVHFLAQQGQSYMIRLGTSPWGGPDITGGTGAFTISCGAPIAPPCQLEDEQCQPPDTFDGVLSARARATSAARFTPVSDGAITDICFWGMYLDEQSDCSPGTSDEFEIRYLRDNDGVPGNPIVGPFSQMDGSLDVVGPARTHRFVAGVAHEYEYTANHVPLYVKAGVCYWIEITNTATDGSCDWLWSVTADDRGQAMRDGSDTDPPDGYDRDDLVTERLAFRTNVALADTSQCPFPPANDDCDSAALITDGSVEFDTLGATTDGPEERLHCYGEEPPCCLFPLGDPHVNGDIWFDYVATCTGVLTVDTGAAFFDTKVAIHEGATCPPADYAVACNDDRAGIDGPRDSRVAVEVTQGQAYKIRVGGFREEAGAGTMHLDCGPRAASDNCEDVAIRTLPHTFWGVNLFATEDCPQIPGTHSWIALRLLEPGTVVLDYEGSPSAFTEASYVLTADCSCGTLIAADGEFLAADGSPGRKWNCLATGTYYYPVLATPGSEGAFQINATTTPCVDPCEASDGDCYADNGTPGCEDVNCCASVCALDDFCCAAAWDGVCARTAAAVCDAFPQSACAEATGDCYVPNDTPGCEDQAVCERVCNCDAYCCIIDWDTHCAGSGYLPEPGCGGASDCDSNGMDDEYELPDHEYDQHWPDCNRNDVLDVCDGQGPGDFTGDGAVDLADYVFFVECFNGPRSRPAPDDHMCIGTCTDVFNTGDDSPWWTVSLADFAVFQNAIGQTTP